MALQGDLASFALPDVLRLLAGTAKSGRLSVDGSTGAGEVLLRDGALAGGSVSTRPSASTAPEIVYELLRFGDGSFVFDDDHEVEGTEAVPVDGALAEAEALHAEWEEVTRVVPTLDHWVAMAPELATGQVTLDGDQWRILAVIAGGAPVRTVGESFGESDLDASKRVKAMAEAGLVSVTEPRGTRMPEDSWTEHRGDEVVPDDLDVLEAEPALSVSAEDDLVRLSAEEGPVVLETSEDALLPEPLPGEGTSFSAAADGQVDSPAFQIGGPGGELAPVDHELDPSYQPPTEPIDPVVEAAAVDPVQDPALAWDALARATGEDGEIGTSEAAFQAVGWDNTPPVDHLEEGAEDDPDRSSLLKFLSSVKP